MPKTATETLELDGFAKYLRTHNLTVVKVKWIEDKSTGLKKPHVWTKRR